MSTLDRAAELTQVRAQLIVALRELRALDRLVSLVGPSSLTPDTLAAIDHTCDAYDRLREYLPPPVTQPAPLASRRAPR